MSATLKALTVRQPWAWAIATGRKDIETRTWKTKYRGWLAIHAGKADDTRPIARRVRQLAPLDLEGRGVRGFIVAIAKVENCRPMMRPDTERALCPYTEGTYSWLLHRVHRLQQPISAPPGRLGLWNLPDAIDSELRREVGIL